MPTDLARELAQGLRILDGALGTQLLVSGFDPRRDLLDAGPAALSLTRPEQVRAVHESYLDAGCEWLTTNTFDAAPADLERVGLARRFDELVERAVRAAREAVDAWREEVPLARVLGSIGPGSDPDAAPRARAEQARALAERLVRAGVDGLLFETATRLDHLEAAFEAVREVAAERGVPVLASVAFGPDGRLRDGAGAAEVATWAAAAGPLLLATNCGRGPAATEADLEALRGAWDGPLGALPTAGLPTDPGDLSSFPVAPHEFGETLAAWVGRYGLAAVGGCCGTSPRHLAALSDALGRARPWAEDGEPRAEEDEEEGGA